MPHDKGLRPPRVTVIAGTENELSRYCTELRRSHLNVLECLGLERIDQLTEANPDVVVVDLSQPGYSEDGLGLLRRFRQNERTKQLPIIFLAESADADTEERFERAGADRLLSKSCPLEVLVCEVRRVIAARRRRAFRRSANIVKAPADSTSVDECDVGAVGGRRSPGF